MKWRCERCGKPHERNDPPCDNCGHQAFEKAVVPVAPEGEGGPLVWVCTECGRAHPRNSPPCSRCGNMTLEQREQSVEDLTLDPSDQSGSGDAEGGDDRQIDAEAATVWACTECGREHPRNTPPCSRCGNMTLEQREQRFEDLQASSDGWLDVVDARYVLGFAGAFLLLGFVLATTFGWFGLGGPPTVEDVPGNAEEAAGLSLAEVEDEYVAALNERRAEQGLDSFDRPETLQQMATYYNQRRVKAEYGDGDPPDAQRVYEEFDYQCQAPALSESPPPVIDELSTFDSEEELATVMAPSRSGQIAADYDEIGVDVHAAPDGTLYVAVFLC